LKFVSQARGVLVPPSTPRHWINAQEALCSDLSHFPSKGGGHFVFGGKRALGGEFGLWCDVFWWKRPDL